MRAINHLIVILIALLAVTACIACRDKDQSDDGEQPIVIRSNDELTLPAQDSIVTAEQLKNTLNGLSSEINDGFDDITLFEQTLDTTDISQLSQSRRAKLRNRILLAKNAVQDKRSRLSKIEGDLESIDVTDKDEVAQTIKNLRQQLNLQKERIDHLSAKLQNSTPKPVPHSDSNDSTRVAKPPQEATQVPSVENAVNNEMLSDEANECFYAMGTRDELRNHKIIDSEFLKKTKVMQSSNLLASYFTKADKRTLNSITIHSKSVTLITNQDPHSFSMVQEGDITIITILNPTLFWEYSNYFVVMTSGKQ